MKPINKILQATMLLSLLVSQITVANENAQTLSPTPPQVEGPFYPGAEIFTQVNENMSNYGQTDSNGNLAEASGQLLLIQGSVLDANGKAIEGAEIQFWQTDGLQGRYLVEQTDKPLDPNFKYAAKSITNSSGRWRLDTVRPMEYEADEDWTRPSHIHLKVFVKGELRLTTQIYFSDEMDLINKDKIIQKLPPDQQKLLIVQLHQGFGIKLGEFQIVLK